MAMIWSWPWPCGANANYTNYFKIFFVKYVFLSEISIKKLFRVNCFYYAYLGHGNGSFVPFFVGRNDVLV